MKITWQFTDGSKSEIEAPDDIGTVILDSRRKEDNLDRKERYHCYSIDALEYGDKDIHTPTSGETPETEYVLAEDNARIREALSALTDIQRRRLLMLANGISLRDIAKVEGTNHKSVEESIISARKKFKKYMANTPTKRPPFLRISGETINHTSLLERGNHYDPQFEDQRQQKAHERRSNQRAQCHVERKSSPLAFGSTAEADHHRSRQQR